MCGRFGRKGSKQKIATAFHVKGGLDETDFEDDDDARPGSIQPVIKMGEDGELTFANMRWGFKTPKALLFNTRADKVASSKFWKKKFEDNRLIVPATSFFEWQGDKGHKTKYEVTIPHHTFFAMAGVWGVWRNPKTGKWEETFSIITSDPNSLMITVHDRQPVILEQRDQPEWFTFGERPPFHALRTFPDTKMKMKPVEGEIKPAQKGLFG
jgi:putative SOS response-associated peptidase YedK